MWQEEDGVLIVAEDLDPKEALVSESRLVGVVLLAVGAFSVGWGCVGRPEFGDLAERTQSLIALLSQVTLTLTHSH